LITARARIYAAAVLAIGAGATVAAAADDAPAATPTQRELLQQINDLKSKVERLEAATPAGQTGAQIPPAATSSAAVSPAAISDGAFASEAVFRDARSRSQLLDTPGSFTAGYTKGKFVIQDDKGDFSLHPNLQFKPRWVANDSQNAKGGTDDDFQSGFELRRMKFGFDGNLFGPNTTYNFLWATDRNTGGPVLEEAWAKYAFTSGALKNFSVKGGQFKDPFAHESLTSSKKLLAAERSLLTDLFAGGDNFVQGVSVGWDDGPKGSPFRFEVAYTDGINAPNQNFQDFPATKANFGVAGRVEYLAFGKWAEYEDFTTAANTEDLLVIGGGVDLTEAGNTDSLVHTVDAQLETGRLGLYGAYYGRSVEDFRLGTGAAATDVNTYDWGFIAQAAYIVNDHLEPFVRYDYIQFDRDGLAASVKQNKVHEITAGMNYYYKLHSAKFTLDFTYLPKGTPVADSGSDVLASDDEAEFLVRAQFQLLL
jgi:hypothetical protein